MELRHIRYFLVLAEELNFSRAAEKLHIAQPPLSKQIKELEEEIGAKLFNRTKRHVELTNAGQVFLDKAYQILDQVEQACISTRLTSTGTEGELVIGFSGSVQD
ncbi:LysR family transcriptional regulator, partial [Bacillus velezensis]